MSGRPRGDVIQEDRVGVYHVWNRTVRQQRLCGVDELTHQDYSHRKTWICDRIRELVQIFAVETCVYAILSNHYHLLVRNRPDLVAFWSDEEIVRRWWQLYPERRNEDGSASEPAPLEIKSLLADASYVEELRRRMSSISWFMKELNQYIAAKANEEDGKTGHFWEGRFKCRSLLKEGAILVCSLYIDLNEIRAKLANVPEVSTFSSSYRRILARIERRIREEQGLEQKPAGDYQEQDQDFWLCPLNEEDRAPLLGPPDAESVVASKQCDLANVNAADAHKQWRHGFLPVTIDEYLDLLDCVGRQVIDGKPGAIDARLEPILLRLGLVPTMLYDVIENFDRWMHGAVGNGEQLADEAARTGRTWIQGVTHCRKAFVDVHLAS